MWPVSCDLLPVIYDQQLVTWKYDLWSVTCYQWLVTCDQWLVTSDFWPVTFEECLLNSDLCTVTCDQWLVTKDQWHLTPDTWHLTPDNWYLTSDTWHLTPDTWHLKKCWHSVCSLEAISFEIRGRQLCPRYFSICCSTMAWYSALASTRSGRTSLFAPSWTILHVPQMLRIKRTDANKASVYCQPVEQNIK